MIRVAVLDSNRCKPKDCGTACIKYCPMVRSSIDAIKIEEDEEKPTIFETLCSGCGICIRKCPFNAITFNDLKNVILETKNMFSELLDISPSIRAEIKGGDKQNDSG